VLGGLAAYAAALLTAVGIAYGAQVATVRSLYTLYQPDHAYLALAELPRARFARLVAVAQAHPAVQARLDRARRGQVVGQRAKFLNYVLREGRYVSEVPMHKPAGARGHDTPATHDGKRYRVVFTRVALRTRRDVQGEDLLWYAVSRTPVAEVWIDLGRAEPVVKVLDPPTKGRYEGVPVPIY
jgi:hypothetical protein